MRERWRRWAAARSRWLICPRVAPGIKVVEKTYSVPINEQPFYGFIEKSSSLHDEAAKQHPSLSSDLARLKNDAQCK
jgi:hypothetical protein